MERRATFTLVNGTRGKIPRVPFSEMKKKVLGDAYDLSLILIGDKRSRTLNRTYRKKDHPTNVLSFPIGERIGEIYIAIPRVRIQAKKFDMRPDEFVGFLFIHGMLHLKGHLHGVTMEKLESKHLRAFHLPDPHAD
jgi:rRNA maturation RNase YbeY